MPYCQPTTLSAVFVETGLEFQQRFHKLMVLRIGLYNKARNAEKHLHDMHLLEERVGVDCQRWL